MISRLILFFVFSIVLGQISAQSDVRKTVSDLLAHPTFEYASVALSVKTIEGDNIIQFNANQKLIPASSLKLITTLLALDALGEDFQFTTHIGYSGNIDRAGNLNGNLIIIGSGDPTLGSRRFGKEEAWNKVLEEIISTVKDKGIKCIEGKVEVKTHVFEGQAICPSWPYADVANYYAGGAWGLNFNENKYDLHFSAAVPEGEVATLDHISPEIPNMVLTSEVVVDGPRTGDNAYIYGDAFNYSKIIRGTIPFSGDQFVIKGAIPNPPLSFAFLLEKELEKNGIKTKGSVVSKKPIKKSEFSALTNFKSPKLSRIVEEANLESINLYCEALLRMLGRKHKKEGSFEAGLEYVEEKLDEMGIPSNSYNINDGSGLSPRNTITANAFTSFLTSVSEDKEWKYLKKYIPQTGESGTVSNLLSNKKGQKKFFLKSGSMGGVLTYTGIFEAKSGKKYAISFMSNNHSNGNRSVRIEAEKVFEALYMGL